VLCSMLFVLAAAPLPGPSQSAHHGRQVSSANPQPVLQVSETLEPTPTASAPAPAPEISPAARESAPEVTTSPARATTPVAGAASPVGTLRLDSTSYCQHGRMADGAYVHAGAVAMNGVPLGSRYRVLNGPLAGAVLTVEDRIGSGSRFDVWLASCSAAISYGRRTIDVEAV
jgi:3D (Asp-Asp-Asp) domain-containing protein